jgi:hypothetical protein
LQAGPKDHLRGLTREQILRAIGTAGFIPLVFGFYGFFIQKRDANLANYAITLFGFAVTLIGFLYGLRTIDTDKSRRETEAAPSTLNPKTAPSTDRPPLVIQGDQYIPAAYGIAFLASAALTFIGTFILLASGIYFTNQTQYVQNVTDKYAVIIVAACILRVIGLPGFHALQSTKARYSSLFGCIIWAIGSVTTVMYFWGMVSGSNIYQALQSYHELNIINNLLTICFSALLAIAIKRAGVFPRWTVYVQILNIINSFWWIAGADNGGPAVDTVERLDAFIGAFTMAVFAIYMVKKQLSINFGITLPPVKN